MVSYLKETSLYAKSKYFIPLFSSSKFSMKILGKLNTKTYVSTL